jgi:hypothetical protein
MTGIAGLASRKRAEMPRRHHFKNRLRKSIDAGAIAEDS